MADNKIEIIASLDIPKSKHNIVGEIKQLQADLQADDNARPKLIARLDIDKSKTLIQSQLNTIVNQANAPTIKVGIDVSSTNATQNIVSGLKDVQTQAQSVSNTVNNLLNLDDKFKTIKPILNNEGLIDTEKTLNKVQKLYQELGAVSVKGIFGNKVTDDGLEQIVVTLNKGTELARTLTLQLGELDKSKRKFTDKDSFYLTKGTSDNSGVQKLTTDIENARAKYSRLLADFKSSNNAILSGLSTPIQQFETSLNNLGKTSSINDVKNSFEALKQSASQISMYLDTTNSAFNKNTNAINHYKSMDNILKEISATFDNLAIKPNVLKNELDGVKTKFAELQTLEKTEGGYTETWAKKYQEVNLELAKVKANIQLVAKAESNSQKADKNSAYQTQLKYLNKIKEETNTIISLRNKMLSAGTGESQIYQEEITKAKKRIQYDTSQLKKKQLLTEEAQRLVNTYQQQLALLEKINNSKATEKLQKSITTAIGNLDSKKLNSTFTRNNTNPEVVQQIAKIDELKAKYQNLLSLFSQSQTPESLTKLRNETLLLDRDYQLLMQSVKNFQGTLRNDKAIDVNANKIKQLRAEIQAYMNLNPKAMNMKLSGGNTVGAELNRMLAQLNDLASPELVASIDRQFKTIGKTVVSMGKEGNTAFGSLLASAKKFGTWMGLTTIISRFVRSIRSMITTVVELDTALTDLKKTFKGTKQDLQAFYSNAPSIAKEFGVSTKNIIEQASAWSRLNKIGLLYGNI